MTQESIHPAPARAASRDARLLQWQQLMLRTGQAMRLGQTMFALATCHEALAVARGLLQEPPPGHVEDAVAALVVSRHNLADLHAETGCIDLAAAQRCRAHEELIDLVTARTAAVELQRAALRHSRETHAGLLLHLQAHGAHPAITRALQAGCLIFAAGPATLH